jgi:hypothetical protein
LGLSFCVHPHALETAAWRVFLEDESADISIDEGVGLQLCVLNHLLSVVVSSLWINEMHLILALDKADGRTGRAHTNSNFRTNADEFEMMGPCSSKVSVFSAVSIVPDFVAKQASRNTKFGFVHVPVSLYQYINNCLIQST